MTTNEGKLTGARVGRGVGTKVGWRSKGGTLVGEAVAGGGVGKGVATAGGSDICRNQEGQYEMRWQKSENTTTSINSLCKMTHE